MQQIQFELTKQNQEISNERGAIRRLIGELNLGNGWIIPAHEEGDGCMGTLSVSQYQPLAVPNATKNLALHITFNIEHLFIPSITGLKRPQPAQVSITLSNLHLTARPEKNQMTISAINASSILDAQISIHRGVNNGWSYGKWEGEEKFTNLAAALGMAADTKPAILNDLSQALQNYSATPLPWLSGIGTTIQNQISTQITNNLNASRIQNGVPNPVGVNVTTENWI